MKTLKTLLLCLVAALPISQISAQCSAQFYPSYQGAGSYFFSTNSYDSLGTPSYSWDFGDGSTASVNSTSHTYTASGQYNVCLTYSNNGCTDTKCDSLYVNICDFAAQIAYSNNGLVVTPYVSTGTSAWTYSWSFPGGTPSTSTDRYPTVTYPFGGKYTATCAVTVPNGCSAQTLTSEINLGCNAAWYLSSYYDTVVTFYPQNPDTAANPIWVDYHWDFGLTGSDTSMARNPTFTFPGWGTYNVSLTVSGNNCADTVMQIVTLAPAPVYYNIQGAVSKGGAGTGQFNIYLIKEDTAGYLSLVNTVMAFDTGSPANNHYFFYNVVPGTYYVKASLQTWDADYASYLPTYHGNVLNWADATAVNVTGHVSGIDVVLIAGVNNGGPGFVGGWVTEGAGLAIGNGGNHRGIGDPLPNVQVNLVTDNDVPVASTLTDANGRYTFSGLALGSYKVYAEEINKVVITSPVTLTANNPSQDNVDVAINSTTAATGVNDIADIKLEGVFPNPVADKAVAKFSLKQNAEVKVMLVNMGGQVITNYTVEMTAGMNDVTINLQNQPAGVYQLSLTNSGNNKVIKLVKTQ